MTAAGRPTFHLPARRDPEWMTQAACLGVDPELFFPDRGGSGREAKLVCARCPVSRECAADALDSDQRYGVWGGLTEQDRKEIRAGVRSAQPQPLLCHNRVHVLTHPGRCLECSAATWQRYRRRRRERRELSLSGGAS